MQHSLDFEEKLAFGQIGESIIAKWLNRRGWNVLPVYEKEIDTAKGPQLFTPGGKLIMPDLFTFKPLSTKALWIEAKHKTVFSWHRKTGKWVTGIDLRHYEDYLSVNSLSPWPVWLLFLHRESSTGKRDEPWPCPTGLFGNELSILENVENHRHDKWGRSGMVYWAHERLKKIASLEEMGLAKFSRN